MNKDIKNYIHNMPKIDLHCHIDGSFSINYIKKTLGINTSDEELSKKLTAPYDCSSLAEYLTCFDLPIQCMQTKETITDGILDIIHQCHEENIAYVELRFAPSCSINDAMTYRDVFEAAIAGTKKGFTQYGVKSNIIACAMRHHSYEDNAAMLKSAREFLGLGVCALDLAGDEKSHGNEEFAELFSYARRLNMPFTIHSGECGSVNNVRLAMEYGAKRVGHGIALIQDEKAISECKSYHLGLELCPTSNYQTHAVKPDCFYPLRSFLDAGLAATINTDNRTVSSTTLSAEYELVCDKYGITENDFEVLYKNSVDISFADDNTKNELLKLI